MLNVESPSVYTDFSALTKLKQAAHEQSPEAIQAVAKQFESVFLNMMLKSMRQAHLSEGLLDSQQSEFYRDMYDQQIALNLAGKLGKGGFGIADFIVKQITPKTAASEPDTENTDSPEEANVSELAVTPLRRSHSAGFAANKPLEASGLYDLESMLSDLEAHQQVMDGQWQALEDEWQSMKWVAEQQATSKQTFINQLMPFAQQAANALGVDPNLLLAQIALETGWGQAIIKNSKGESSFNLFNIKADKAWTGKQTNALTLEYDAGLAKKEMAGFRVYDTYKDSFSDYVDFMKSNSRYSEALKKAANPAKYIHELHQAGYATDPRYAEKVMNIYLGQIADSFRLASGHG